MIDQETHNLPTRLPVRPGVTFFELATGHYPMLSTPAELADVLVRAAAGEGVGLYES